METEKKIPSFPPPALTCLRMTLLLAIYSPNKCACAGTDEELVPDSAVTPGACWIRVTNLEGVAGLNTQS